MTNWSREIQLERVGGTDLFCNVQTYPGDARFEYQLLVDDASGVDPCCHYRVLHGLGANSELAMPDYSHHAVFADVRDGTPGNYDRVTRRSIESSILEGQN